jgi:hypothetical protein
MPAYPTSSFAQQDIQVRYRTLPEPENVTRDDPTPSPFVTDATQQDTHGPYPFLPRGLCLWCHLLLISCHHLCGFLDKLFHPPPSMNSKRIALFLQFTCTTCPW